MGCPLCVPLFAIATRDLLPHLLADHPTALRIAAVALTSVPLLVHRPAQIAAGYLGLLAVAFTLSMANGRDAAR